MVNTLFRFHYSLVPVTNDKLSFASILLTLLSLFVICSSAIYSSFYPEYKYLPIERAYADGLTQENLPPASLGDREGSLFVKISPPLYTTESKENAFMQFRLFDANTNETIEFVTYDITVSKGTTPSADEEPLLRDFFQSPSGLLTLQVDPTNDTSLTIFGNRDPFLGAWVADPGGTINIRGPLLQEGGLYRFDIQIFGIDNPRNIFIPEQAPSFESFLSVGDVYNFKDLQYAGETFNSTLISYYDEIQDFKFDSETGSFSWSMPFYYNLTRLRDNPIFVHEEIKLPKALFGDGMFNATVNGDPVSGRTLAVDPFTDPDAVMLHYLINKNAILELAEEWQQQRQIIPNNEDISGDSSNNTSDNNQTGFMTFVLDTSGGAQGEAQTSQQQQQQQQQTSSSDLISDTGGIHAFVSWSPQPLVPNSNSTVRINFTDAFSGGPLNADVMYDLSILDNNGTIVIEKEGLLAEDSIDSQILTFPMEGQYQMELHINGLRMADQDTPDLTRNGIARGYVIV
ncbi:MAG: hypothetical protein ACRD8W_03665 [Nitrososphaeraceae archaeon]